MKNKLGRIRISDAFLQPENIAGLSRLFQIFFPIDIEDKRYSYREVVYTGYCEQFDEIKEGELIPFYEVVFTDIKVTKVNG